MRDTMSDGQRSTAAGMQVDPGDPIKTILVPVAGSETDRTVMGTAWALARPLCAHLDFLHLRLDLADTALLSNVDFCQGPVLSDALHQLRSRHANLATSATNFVRQFCHDHGIDECQAPQARSAVTANCIEKAGPATETLLFHARHSDLIVLGRRQHADGMPVTLIEDLLVQSGRPLLLAAQDVSPDLYGTVVVGWKETANAARAINAAMPILQRARRVVVVKVAEDNTPDSRGLEHLSAQLAWHGVVAEVRRIGDGVAPACTLLTEVASELQADLLVVGGFGHSRLRETVFGGVTRSLIDDAAIPVFIAH
jgi:nucleotide-binding universal stress UspA family protein